MSAAERKPVGLVAVAHGGYGQAIERSRRANTHEGRRAMEADDYLGWIRRSLRAMGRALGDQDPTGLRVFAELRQELDDAEHDAITKLIEEGYSWRDLGRALGQTHTAVFGKYQRYEEANR